MNGPGRILGTGSMVETQQASPDQQGANGSFSQQGASMGEPTLVPVASTPRSSIKQMGSTFRGQTFVSGYGKNSRGNTIEDSENKDIKQYGSLFEGTVSVTENGENRDGNIISDKTNTGNDQTYMGNGQPRADNDQMDIDN